MRKTLPTEIKNKIQNKQYNNDQLHIYLREYSFTESDMRELWDHATEWMWINYQRNNMSNDFKTEISSKDKRTAAFVEQFNLKDKVLSYDWSKASKNKWNKFKRFIKEDLKWHEREARGCNDYQKLVDIYIDNYETVHFDETEDNDFLTHLDNLEIVKNDALKLILNWLNKN